MKPLSLKKPFPVWIFSYGLIIGFVLALIYHSRTLAEEKYQRCIIEYKWGPWSIPMGPFTDEVKQKLLDEREYFCRNMSK